MGRIVNMKDIATNDPAPAGTIAWLDILNAKDDTISNGAEKIALECEIADPAEYAGKRVFDDVFYEWEGRTTQKMADLIVALDFGKLGGKDINMDAGACIGKRIKVELGVESYTSKKEFNEDGTPKVKFKNVIKKFLS